MRSSARFVLAAALAVATPGLAAAQERPPKDDGRRPPAPPDGERPRDGDGRRPGAPPEGAPRDGQEPPDAKERRQELRRKIQALRMARLTQVLDLDDATAAKLFPVINKSDEKSAELAEERGPLLRKLGDLARGKPAEADVVPALDRLLEIAKALHRLEEETNASVRALLTATQMAKLLMFNERFHEEVRELIHGARDGGGRDGPRDGRENDRRDFDRRVANAQREIERARRMVEDRRREAEKLTADGKADEAKRLMVEVERMAAEIERRQDELAREVEQRRRESDGGGGRGPGGEGGEPRRPQERRPPEGGRPSEPQD